MPMDRVVEAPPPVRQEGDTVIIPVPGRGDRCHEAAGVKGRDLISRSAKWSSARRDRSICAVRSLISIGSVEPSFKGATSNMRLRIISAANVHLICGIGEELGPPSSRSPEEWELRGHGGWEDLQGAIRDGWNTGS